MQASTIQALLENRRQPSSLAPAAAETVRELCRTAPSFCLAALRDSSTHFTWKTNLVGGLMRSDADTETIVNSLCSLPDRELLSVLNGLRYDRINGHRSISLLEDYDLSVRMFKEKDIRCRYDTRQEVYTSARRLQNLFTYTLVYFYGHYHYHFTRDYQRLLTYPRFDKMDREVILDVTGIRELNHKLEEIQEKISRNIDGIEGKLSGK